MPCGRGGESAVAFSGSGRTSTAGERVTTESLGRWDAGWYEDPDSSAGSRYWNGERWTAETRGQPPDSDEAPPGYYAGSTSSEPARYWDGADWTDRTSEFTSGALARWPAGWYEDPSNEAGSRYWDGERWTKQVRAELPDSEEVPPGYYAPRIPGTPARYWDGDDWTERTSFARLGGSSGDTGAHTDTTSEPVEVNRAGAALAAVGATLMVIAVFLPRVESAKFGRVQENTLIQSGDGWVFIGLAVGIVAAVYAAFQRERRTWAVLTLGLIAVAIAVYDGTGDRLELRSASGGAFGLPSSATEKASPGVGIYAVGAGGLIAAIGGAWLAGLGAASAGSALKTRRTKNCPDCAETVLAEARVCKHCGHRFSEAL
jgi:hypothetical protein